MSYLDFDKVTFQYFPSAVWKPDALGFLTLRQFLESHKNPKKEIVEVFEKIKKAAAEGDLETKDRLKQNFLYYFLPSCIMQGGRKHENIVEYRPLMLVEFDKIEYPEELKQFLFDRIKSCIAAWLSPSRKGIKLLIRIPTPKSIEEYKEYFCAMAYHLDKYLGFDGVNFNICLPLFISYDENILIRKDAVEWNKRGGKINAFKVHEGEFSAPEDINEEDRQEVINTVTFVINKIEDGAHPKLVSMCSALGGFVGSGYISYDDAIALIDELIENNAYMQKNVRGYQKTAREMVNRGLKSPLLLRRHEEQ